MFGSIGFGVKIRCFEGLDAYSNTILYINKDGFKLFTGNKSQFVNMVDGLSLTNSVIILTM